MVYLKIAHWHAACGHQTSKEQLQKADLQNAEPSTLKMAPQELHINGHHIQNRGQRVKRKSSGWRSRISGILLKMSIWDKKNGGAFAYDFLLFRNRKQPIYSKAIC